jgi:hypothetical protein
MFMRETRRQGTDFSGLRGFRAGPALDLHPKTTRLRPQRFASYMS